MKKAILLLAAAGLMLVSARAIFAHHAAVMFDTDTPVTIKGTLRRAEIINPHSLLYVEQVTPDGTIVWAVEGPSTTGLLRRGIDGNVFSEGDVIEACGYVLKDEAANPQAEGRLLVAEVLVMPDGAARLWSPYGNRHCQDQGIYSIVVEQ
jgi:hypothetical protein